MKKILMASALATSFALPVVASEGAPDVPPALKMMVDSGGAEIVDTFDTESDNVQGFVVKRPSGTHVLIYGIDGYSLAGVLINEKGENLTRRYAEQYIPKPDFSDIGQALKNSDHLVTEGASEAPEMYVFADPNCGYCKKFYTQVQPLVKAGKVRINWVMVGFLHPTSKNIASAIFDGGKEAMAKAEAANSKTSGPYNKVVPVEHQQALNEHAELMKKAGINGTPGFVYKEEGRWVTHSGVPSEASFNMILSSIDRED